MRWTRSVIGVALFWAMGAAAAGAQPITVGPYWFPDESYFADDAVLDGLDVPGRWAPWLASGTELLVGYSPDSGLHNLGCAYGTFEVDCVITRELLDFIFIDVVAVNGPGPDLVIFDARYSHDDYEVAVRPVGGEWSQYIWHVVADQRATGVETPGRRLVGVDIDLSKYGIPPGVAVDRIRIRADLATFDPAVRHTAIGHPENDPVMAAVLNAPCECDDGIECTWDCDASGGCASTPHDPGTPCSAGVCDGAANPSCVECVEDAHCPSERPRCDPSAQVCVECLGDGDCEDDDACTVDACEVGLCTHTSAPAGAPCEEGICDGAAAPSCVACLDDAHCDDELACTHDTCVDSECVHASFERGTRCDDGYCDGASLAPRCVECLSDGDCDEFASYCMESGACAACRDASHCAANECATAVECAEGGCEYTPLPRGSGCSRGVCDGEPHPRCVGCLSAEQCDDGDPCTADRCEDNACVHSDTCLDAGPAPIDASYELLPPPGCGCRIGPSPTSSLLASAPLILLALCARGRRRGGRERLHAR